jgi:hypothetical protein
MRNAVQHAKTVKSLGDKKASPYLAVDFGKMGKQ